MSDVLRFNPLDPGFLADPYPAYHRLRREDPVHRSLTGSWVLTRHDDIKAVLTDARFRTVDTPERVIERGQKYARTGPNLDHLNRLMRGFFIFSNPPAHALSRAPARAAFATVTPAALSRLVGEITTELIASLAGRPQADLVADFTEPLASRTIGRMMGLADAEAARLQALNHRLAPVLETLLPLESYREMNEVAGEILAVFEAALDGSRAPTGFLRELAANRDDGEALARLPPVAAAIFFAGQETTVNALANSIQVLAGQPERVAEMLRSPAPAPNWVQELLRFESPVQLIAREALTGLELRGRAIQPGQRLVLYLGAANRDPAVFPDPDRLDFARDARAHLAFSAGQHRCLGAHLAVEEMQQGLPALFGRFPRLRLVHPAPRWRKNITMRGPAELVVELPP